MPSAATAAATGNRTTTMAAAAMLRDDRDAAAVRAAAATTTSGAHAAGKAAVVAFAAHDDDAHSSPREGGGGASASAAAVATCSLASSSYRSSDAQRRALLESLYANYKELHTQAEELYDRKRRIEHEVQQYHSNKDAIDALLFRRGAAAEVSVAALGDHDTYKTVEAVVQRFAYARGGHAEHTHDGDNNGDGRGGAEQQQQQVRETKALRARVVLLEKVVVTQQRRLAALQDSLQPLQDELRGLNSMLHMKDREVRTLASRNSTLQLQLRHVERECAALKHVRVRRESEERQLYTDLRLLIEANKTLERENGELRASMHAHRIATTAAAAADKRCAGNASGATAFAGGMTAQQQQHKASAATANECAPATPHERRRRQDDTDNSPFAGDAVDGGDEDDVVSVDSRHELSSAQSTRMTEWQLDVWRSRAEAERGDGDDNDAAVPATEAAAVTTASRAAHDTRCAGDRVATRRNNGRSSSNNITDTKKTTTSDDVAMRAHNNRDDDHAMDDANVYGSDAQRRAYMNAHVPISAALMRLHRANEHYLARVEAEVDNALSCLDSDANAQRSLYTPHTPPPAHRAQAEAAEQSERTASRSLSSCVQVTAQRAHDTTVRPSSSAAAHGDGVARVRALLARLLMAVCTSSNSSSDGGGNATLSRLPAADVTSLLHELPADVAAACQAALQAHTHASSSSAPPPRDVLVVTDTSSTSTRSDNDDDNTSSSSSSSSSKLTTRRSVEQHTRAVAAPRHRASATTASPQHVHDALRRRDHCRTRNASATAHADTATTADSRVAAHDTSRTASVRDASARTRRTHDSSDSDDHDDDNSVDASLHRTQVFHVETATATRAMTTSAAAAATSSLPSRVALQWSSAAAAAVACVAHLRRHANALRAALAALQHEWLLHATLMTTALALLAAPPHDDDDDDHNVDEGNAATVSRRATAARQPTTRQQQQQCRLLLQRAAEERVQAALRDRYGIVLSLRRRHDSTRADDDDGDGDGDGHDGRLTDTQWVASQLRRAVRRIAHDYATSLLVDDDSSNSSSSMPHRNDASSRDAVTSTRSRDERADAAPRRDDNVTDRDNSNNDDDDDKYVLRAHRVWPSTSTPQQQQQQQQQTLPHMRRMRSDVGDHDDDDDDEAATAGTMTDAHVLSRVISSLPYANELLQPPSQQQRRQQQQQQQQHARRQPASLSPSTCRDLPRRGGAYTMTSHGEQATRASPPQHDDNSNNDDDDDAGDKYDDTVDDYRRGRDNLAHGVRGRGLRHVAHTHMAAMASDAFAPSAVTVWYRYLSDASSVHRRDDDNNNNKYDGGRVYRSDGDSGHTHDDDDDAHDSATRRVARHDAVLQLLRMLRQQHVAAYMRFCHDDDDGSSALQPTVWRYAGLSSLVPCTRRPQLQLSCASTQHSRNDDDNDNDAYVDDGDAHARMTAALRHLFGAPFDAFLHARVLPIARLAQRAAAAAASSSSANDTQLLTSCLMGLCAHAQCRDGVGASGDGCRDSDADVSLRVAIQQLRASDAARRRGRARRLMQRVVTRVRARRLMRRAVCVGGAFPAYVALLYSRWRQRVARDGARERAAQWQQQRLLQQRLLDVFGVTRAGDVMVAMTTLADAVTKSTRTQDGGAGGSDNNSNKYGSSRRGYLDGCRARRPARNDVGSGASAAASSSTTTTTTPSLPALRVALRDASAELRRLRGPVGGNSAHFACVRLPRDETRRTGASTSTTATSRVRHDDDERAQQHVHGAVW